MKSQREGFEMLMPPQTSGEAGGWRLGGMGVPSTPRSGSPPSPPDPALGHPGQDLRPCSRWTAEAPWGGGLKESGMTMPIHRAASPK